MASRVRARLVLAAAWAIFIVLAPGNTWWLVPLMIAARALAAYPLRKALQGETWHPPAYLSFFTRLVAGLFGFWLLLIWAPSLEGLFGNADWIAALFVAAALIAWNRWYGHVARWMMRAHPVSDPLLVERLAVMAARADVPPPCIDVVPLGGGVLANAVALPSRHDPSVLMTSTFTERFSHDEIVAICAHEIAHLEYYSGARLMRLEFLTIALALGGAFVEPAARLLVPAAQSWLFTTWLVFVVTFQAIRARSRQKNETASDLRAVALTGDPDALASALVKLHAMARVPRRWDAKVERNATHPSLARRIQAIRAAAGREAPALERPEEFASGEMVVTFESDRLRWSADELATQSVGYRRLTELRFDVSRSQAPKLVAVDRGGQRWTFPLSADDIPRAQRILDTVDVQLGEPAAAPTVNFAALRLMSLLTAMVAATASQFAVLLPIALAVARPSGALTAGAAAGALASALVAWRDGAEAGSGLWPALTIALCGAALLALAWVGRKDEDSQPLARPFAVLGLSSLLAWSALLLSGVSVLRLHQSAHASPAAVVIPAALAAALWSRPGIVRRAAPAVFLVAALVFAMGSRTYLESFSRDRFIAQGPALAFSGIAGPALLEVPISMEVSTARLSPDGHSVALGSDDDDDGPRVFQIGPVAGPFESIDCDNAFFVDDRRLLVVNHLRSAVRLRIVGLKPGLPAIEDRLVEDIRGATVEFRQAAGTWTVLGTGTNGEIVRLEGNVRGGPPVERRWADASEPRRGTWVQPVAATRDRVLMRRNRYHAGFFGSRYYALLNMLGPSWTESDFWIADTAGTRRLVGTSDLTVDCRPFAVNDEVSGCSVFDGVRTTLFSLDLRSGDLDARATVQGRLGGADYDGSGWMTAHLDGQPIALRLEQTRGWQIPAEPRTWVTAVGASSGGLATVAQDRRNSVLRVYALPPR